MCNGQHKERKNPANPWSNSFDLFELFLMKLSDFLRSKDDKPCQ